MASKGLPLSRRVEFESARQDDRHVHGDGRVASIQRARLILAMTEIAAESGFSQAAVTQVVTRAGVSRRTFYELFTDREECFMAALDAAIADLSECVRSAYEPRATWHVRVRGSLASVLGFMDERPAAGRLLVVSSPGGGHDALQRRGRLVEKAVMLVEEGARERSNAIELPQLMAEGVVGGALSVLQRRLMADNAGSAIMLLNPLMSMIVLPYLGAAAARRESERPIEKSPVPVRLTVDNPLKDLGIRLTYRTVEALVAVAENPRSSNRSIAEASGIEDQGQVSKLLARLERLGFIENARNGLTRGAPNGWVLTRHGREVTNAITTTQATLA